MTSERPIAPTDHFGSAASAYAAARPTYPLALYEWLGAVAPGRAIAWDCACGSGQATAGLVDQFEFVIATDVSTLQLAHAPPLPRVAWSLAPAEASGLPGHSVDAVVIAQALHWFDLERFWPEVRRVVRPGGIVTAWSYAHQQTDDATLNTLLHDFAHGALGRWWPAERRHVDAGYRTLAFPFPSIATPTVVMEAEWTVDRELDYLRSWSAVARSRSATGRDPLATFVPVLRQAWGDGPRIVRWPLTILAGRVT